jgi:hypothetical protein
MELAWTVVGILVPFLVGAAMNLVGMTPAHFRAARACFVLSAILLGGMSVMWQVTTMQPLWFRMVTGGSIGALIGIGVPEGFRWVGHRQTITQPQNEKARAELVLNIEQLPLPLRDLVEVASLFDAGAGIGDVPARWYVRNSGGWPTAAAIHSFAKFIYRYELMNFSPNPKFNVMLNCLITKQRATWDEVRGPSACLETISRETVKIRVPVIDPNGGKFVFYIYNTSTDCVAVSFTEEVTEENNGKPIVSRMVLTDVPEMKLMSLSPMRYPQ